MSLTVHPKDIVEASESPLLAAAEHWERKPLGEVATIVNGYAFASKLFSRTEGFPLIRIRDISNGTTTERFKGPFEARYLIRSGDLLVGMDGDFNVARWSGPPALLNQRVMKIEPTAEILDIDFLTHLLPGYLQAIHDLTSSTTVKHLSSRDVERLPIPVPEIEEQQKIATQVAALLQLVGSSSDRLAAIPALIKKFRQSVLAAACSGQLTANWREANPETETGQRTVAQLLTQTHKKKLKINPEQPDVDIPESWAWAAIGQIAAIRGGIQKQPHRAPKGNAYPYLRVANVGRNRLDLTEMALFELAPGELETYRLDYGDLLVVEGNGSFNEIGRASIWRSEIADCVHQNHIIRVRFSSIMPEFVSAFWNSPVGIEQVTATAVTTSGLYSLSTGKIASLMIPVPGKDEQAEIVRRVDSLFALADSIESRLADATTQVERTTQAILAKAFRGELNSAHAPAQTL